VRWQIWQRMTGRCVTVTGKREDFELLIATNNARARPAPARGTWPEVARLRLGDPLADPAVPAAAGRMRPWRARAISRISPGAFGVSFSNKAPPRAKCPLCAADYKQSLKDISLQGCAGQLRLHIVWQWAG
jgi:hypothetical protein